MSLPKNTINLIYIRAAIDAATGVHLSLLDTKRYLIEEGFITATQAREEATVFRGYGEFYDYDYSDNKDDGQSTKELNFSTEETYRRKR